MAGLVAEVVVSVASVLVVAVVPVVAIVLAVGFVAEVVASTTNVHVTAIDPVTGLVEELTASTPVALKVFVGLVVEVAASSPLGAAMVSIDAVSRVTVFNKGFDDPYKKTSNCLEAVHPLTRNKASNTLTVSLRFFILLLPLVG